MWRGRAVSARPAGAGCCATRPARLEPSARTAASSASARMGVPVSPPPAPAAAPLAWLGSTVRMGARKGFLESNAGRNATVPTEVAAIGSTERVCAILACTAGTATWRVPSGRSAPAALRSASVCSPTHSTATSGTAPAAASLATAVCTARPSVSPAATGRAARRSAAALRMHGVTTSPGGAGRSVPRATMGRTATKSAQQGGSGPAACCSAPAAGLPAMQSAGGACVHQDGQGTTAPKPAQRVAGASAARSCVLSVPTTAAVTPPRERACAHRASLAAAARMCAHPAGLARTASRAAAVGMRAIATL